MRKQRIVEPAQRAKGRRSANRSVIAIGFEPFDFYDRLFLGKITFVGHAADYRKPPGVRPKLGLWRGDNDIGQVWTIDIRIARIAAADSEIQLLPCVVPH